MIWILLTVFLAGIALGAFTVLLLGIRTEERHMTLTGQPRTLAGASTRRLLSPYGRRSADSDFLSRTAREEVARAQPPRT